MYYMLCEYTEANTTFYLLVPSNNPQFDPNLE